MKGFEPLNVGSKFRCLTTWLHPICSPNLFLELVAPQVGFEPTTWRLTAVRSTTELLEIGDWTSPNLIKKKMWFNFKKTSFFEIEPRCFFEIEGEEPKSFGKRKNQCVLATKFLFYPFECLSIWCTQRFGVVFFDFLLQKNELIV